MLQAGRSNFLQPCHASPRVVSRAADEARLCLTECAKRCGSEASPYRGREGKRPASRCVGVLFSNPRDEGGVWQLLPFLRVLFSALWFLYVFPSLTLADRQSSVRLKEPITRIRVNNQLPQSLFFPSSNRFGFCFPPPLTFGSGTCRAPLQIHPALSERSGEKVGLAGWRAWAQARTLIARTSLPSNANLPSPDLAIFSLFLPPSVWT
ncbi:hypothetical protein B0T22DRAFT_271520 [Podospora appendiculata]|uniref:Uncharacterized protein n=1 Tax=Podospora appendiculata TaxID=314037 RepID=A0AAE0X496_9PEZI|nr:hypothetical protein B0T22DRAFT_271520 [Podospora appendiculata]